MNDLKITNKNHFYNYYEKGDDNGRLKYILLGFAFILCPTFAFFFKWVGAPESLFISLLSASIVFPVLLFVERTVPFFKNKLPQLYFMFFNAIMFYTLYELHFAAYNLFDISFFFAVFATLNFAIQRFYYSLVLIINTAFFYVLLNHFYPLSSEIQMGAYVTLFMCIAVFFLAIYYSRNKMINSIQDHNKYLKQIVNNMGHGVLLFQMRGNAIFIIDFNIELMNVMNEKRSDEIEDRMRRAMSIEDIQHLIVLTEEEAYVKKINIEDERILEVKFTKIDLKKGTFYIATVLDITEKIRENELIRQNEKKYKNLVIRNQTGVFTLDLKGAILDCNPAFLDLFNRSDFSEINLFPEPSEWRRLLETIQLKETLSNYRKIYVNELDQETYFVYNFYYDYELDQVEGNLVDLTDITLSAKAVQESEKKYRSIYEESSDSILLLDEDRIIDINSQGLKLLGKDNDEVIEQSLWDFSYNQSPKLKSYYDHYFRQLAEKKSIRFNWVFSKNKSFIETVVSIVELKTGDDLSYQCVIHDETERNRNVRALESGKKAFESIIENTPEGFLIYRAEEFVYASSAFYRILEIPSIDAKEIQINQEIFGKKHNKIKDWINEHQIDKKTKQKQFEILVKDKRIEIDLTIVSIIFEGTEAVMLILKDVSLQNKLSKEILRAEILQDTNIQLAKEIEERNIVEQKLESEYMRTRAIFDSSPNTLLLTLTPNLQISTFNQQSKSYFDFQTNKTLAEGIGFEDYFRQIITEIKLRYFRFLLSGVRKGKTYQFEVKFINVHHEKKWLEIYLNPILNVKNVLTEFSIVIHDITDKKSNEKEMISSLKEKEVLLKEVHHRVKNNLQIISSILNLQTSYVEDEKVLEILEESRHRIRSMAIIHESLYQTKNFSSINFKNYSRELVRNLISSYQFNKGLNVELVEEVDQVELTLDQAIPCGLIINELITNSMKYAFNNKKEGVIYLELKDKNNILTLVVGDNGPGLPDKFDINDTETLGLQLVVSLVEQLEGEIELERTKGIKYLITFEKQKL